MYGLNIETGGFENSKRKLDEYQKKIVKALKALLSRLEKVANSTNTIDDGTDEGKLKSLNENAPLEKKIVTKEKTCIKPVLKTEQKIEMHDVLKLSSLSHYWFVYDMYKRESDNKSIVLIERLGSEKRGYQRIKTTARRCYSLSSTIIREYDKITPDTLEKAKYFLDSETKEYDCYLTGQCYGFKLYEGDVEKENCWGFLGPISNVTQSIKECLPHECRNLTDLLKDYSEIDENGRKIMMENKIDTVSDLRLT